MTSILFYCFRASEVFHLTLGSRELSALTVLTFSVRCNIYTRIKYLVLASLGQNITSKLLPGRMHGQRPPSPVQQVGLYWWADLSEGYQEDGNKIRSYKMRFQSWLYKALGSKYFNIHRFNVTLRLRRPFSGELLWLKHLCWLASLFNLSLQPDLSDHKIPESKSRFLLHQPPWGSSRA